MLEFFKNHKIIILRIVGGFMLVVAFVVHFWEVPKDTVTMNQVAVANVARIEASAVGKGTSSSSKGSKSSGLNGSPFMEQFNNTKQKQLEYLMILMMILGVGFLGYSFIKKDKS